MFYNNKRLTVSGKITGSEIYFSFLTPFFSLFTRTPLLSNQKGRSCWEGIEVYSDPSTEAFVYQLIRKMETDCPYVFESSKVSL